MHLTYSIGVRSGLQQVSPVPALMLRSHTAVTRAEHGSALSCWNNKGRPWKDFVWMAAYEAPKAYVAFSINIAFADVYATPAMETNTPPFHHICWLLDICWLLEIFPSLCQPILDELGLREAQLLWMLFILHMAFTLHGRLFICICSWVVVFTDNVFPKCSRFHVATFFIQSSVCNVAPEGSKVTGN